MKLAMPFPVKAHEAREAVNEAYWREAEREAPGPEAFEAFVSGVAVDPMPRIFANVVVFDHNHIAVRSGKGWSWTLWGRPFGRDLARWSPHTCLSTLAEVGALVLLDSPIFNRRKRAEFMAALKQADNFGPHPRRAKPTI